MAPVSYQWGTKQLLVYPSLAFALCPCLVHALDTWIKKMIKKKKKKKENANHTEISLCICWKGWNEKINNTDVGKGVGQPEDKLNDISSWKIFWNFLVNSAYHLPYHPVILCIGIYPRKWNTHRDFYINVQATLFTMTQAGNNPKVHQQVTRKANYRLTKDCNTSQQLKKKKLPYIQKHRQVSKSLSWVKEAKQQENKCSVLFVR